MTIAFFLTPSLTLKWPCVSCSLFHAFAASMCFEPLIAVSSGSKKRGQHLLSHSNSKTPPACPFVSVKDSLQENFTAMSNIFNISYCIHSRHLPPVFRIGVAHAVQDTGGRLDILSGCVYIFISSAFIHMYIYIIPRFHLLTRCVIKLLPFHLL